MFVAHLQVPLCIAGAVMDPGSETKPPSIGGLKENTRTSWEDFRLAFFGLCLLRGADVALMYDKSEYDSIIGSLVSLCQCNFILRAVLIKFATISP